MDLSRIFDRDKSHYVYIKDFDRFMFHKIKNKNKKYFWESRLPCFSSKNVLTEHKKVGLKIYRKQAVRLEKGTIKFRNDFKQVLVPFKIYCNCECILNSAESYEGSCSKNIKIIFVVVLLANLFMLIINLVSQLIVITIIMILLMMINTEKLEALGHCSESLIVIITKQ